jgi:hypothetical protein
MSVLSLLEQRQRCADAAGTTHANTLDAIIAAEKVLERRSQGHRGSAAGSSGTRGAGYCSA